MPSKDDKSEFETIEYSAKLADTFATGERIFMSKLRNYCTHYSIPLPDLSTTLKWEQGMAKVLQVNTLQLDRDRLLRWDGWGGPAKEYLKQQDEHLDLAPVISRYVHAAAVFAAWFWSELNARSAELIDEISAKGMELHLWQEEMVGTPDWVRQGGKLEPPPGWNGRIWKAGLRRDRFAHGTRGFRLWQVDDEGAATLMKDDDWRQLPRL